MHFLLVDLLAMACQATAAARQVILEEKAAGLSTILTLQAQLAATKEQLESLQAELPHHTEDLNGRRTCRRQSIEDGKCTLVEAKLLTGVLQTD